jgi:hypothetical chaperone protein
MYWDSVSTNDVGAQTTFYSQRTGLSLDRLRLDTTEPHLLDRFIALRQNKQNYQVVRSAEETKIKLSEQHSVLVELEKIELGLSCELTRLQFEQAVERPLAKMMALMSEAIKQAGQQPELIYVTGGSAKSPLIRYAIEQQLGNIEVVDGDHFGSVTAGLTVWAERLFR